MSRTISAVSTDLVADARHAFRQMRRAPGFTVMVLAALGLGIGATVALVSVVDSLLLRPLPISREAGVRVFWQDYSWTDEEYDFLRDRIRVFDKLAVFSTDEATYAPNAHSGETASALSVVVSSPTLFDVLGVRPALGRAFDANDDHPGAAPVVVISYGMWQHDLGGDPAIIGRSIVLDAKPVTVIGVMPRGFFFPNPELRAWRPLQLDATQTEYKSGYLVVVARARQGATDAQVNGEMQRLAQALRTRFTYPAAWDHGRDAAAIPVHTYVLGKVREPLILLLGAVALLLIIACGNAAALMLARTSDRSGEMTLRAALGASSGRVARQVLAESLVLALSAAVIGSLIATAGFRVFVSRLPLTGGLESVTTVGGATFVTAFVLALAIAIVVSAVQVRHLLRGALDAGVARERGEQGLQRGARRTHAVIISLQVAFAVLLVVGATLLIRSVSRIREIDPGLDPRGVSAYNVFAGTSVPRAARAQLFQTVIDRVRALPGVTAAGMTNRLPVRDLGYQTTMSIEGRPDLQGARKPTSLYRTVTSGFFKTMGMRIVVGRGIDSTDEAETLPVAVVSESFARAMWPGESAIGKHVVEGWSGRPVSRAIVGVAREVRLAGLMSKPPFALWIPLTQAGGGQLAAVLVVKSGAPAALTIPAVRRAITGSDSRIAIARTQTMSDAIDLTLAAPLQLRFFFALFAALALALGAIGVFGVVSYAVSRRRLEFAVRMALGASPREVRSEILTFALAPVVIGIGVGSLAAVGGTRWVSAILYGVAPTDATSFVFSAAALLGAGALAAIVPAVRAGRTSPAEALRA
jgi:putative ABC transport system permease protein